jgi:hypothetical protein
VITTAEPIDFDTLRIRHDFFAVPNLRVSADTIAAAHRIAPRHALLALQGLVMEGFVERPPDGHYARSTGALLK